MSEEYPFIGEVRPFLGEIPERGWLPCDGRPLERRQYAALENLLGERFGGDAEHFNLPDLRGRVAAGVDPARQRFVGDTSGATREPEEAIPYAVVNWAICVEGIYPQVND